MCDCASLGQLTRAAVELAKNWRTDKYLRRLDVSLRRTVSSAVLAAWPGVTKGFGSALDSRDRQSPFDLAEGRPLILCYSEHFQRSHRQVTRMLHLH